MSAVAQIPISFVPQIDVASFNAILASLKQSLGALGKDIKPIDSAKLNGELALLKNGVSEFADGFNKVKENADKAGESGSNLNKLFQFNQLSGAVTQVAGAFQGVLAVGNEYEATLAAVGAVTGQSGEGLTKLGDGARDLAKEFGGSASDNLKSYQGILSKLGPQVAENADALKSMGTTVNTLSAASGDDAATSMSALVDTMLQLGLTTGDAAKDADQMVKVGDALAVSAKVGAAEIPQVAQSMLQVGVAAKGAKLGLEGTVSAIQVLSVGGKTGSEAGVALRNVLGMIQKASGPAEAAMGKLGTSSKELGQILTTQGLGAALEKIQGGMNKLGSAAEKNSTLMEIFGTENASAAGILLDNAGLLDSYKTQIEAGVAAGAAGTDGMAAQANARLGTAEAITKRIVAQVEDVFIGISQTMGSGVSAALTATTQLAPTITSLAGIKNIIPSGSVDSIKNFAVSILTKLVPGLMAQFGAQTAVAASGAASAAATTLAGTAAAESGVAASAGAGGFNALWTAITGPIGLTIAGFVAIGAALYLMYENVAWFRDGVNEAVDFVSAGWQIVEPLFAKTIPTLQSLGGVVLDFLLYPFSLAKDVVLELAGAFSTSDGGVETSSASLRILGGIVQYFGDKLNQVKAYLDGFKASISSLSGGIAGVVGALAKGDISGAVSAFGDAGKGAVGAFQEGFKNSYDASTTEDLKERMKTQLEGGITINAKIEQTANFDELIASYEKAQTKINELQSKKNSGQELTADEQTSLKKLQDEADRTGKRIAEIAPSAKEGISVVRDESGKLREVMTINTESAKKFGEAQKQAYSSDLKASQSEVSANLLKQSSLYKEQEQKLKQIAESATTAAKAGDTDTARKLMKDYEDLRVKVDENGKTLVESFNSAGKAGLLTEDAVNKVGGSIGKTGEEAKKGFLLSALKDAAEAGRTTDKDIAKIATRFGTTTEEAKRLLAEQEKQSKEATKTADAVSGIAKSFEEVKGAADNAVKDSLTKAKTTALQLQQARARGDKDEAARLKRVVDAEIQAGKEAVKQKKNLEKLSDDIEIATGAKEAKKAKDKKDASDTEFQRIKKKEEADSKTFQQELELQKLQEIMSGERKEGDETELYYEQLKYESFQRNIEQLKEKLKISKEERLLPDNVKIKLDAKEKDEVAEFIGKVNGELLQQQQKVKKLEIKANLDAEKLREQYRKLELSKLEQEVELKVVLPDNYAVVKSDLESVRAEIARNTAQGNAQLNDELIRQESSLQQQLNAIYATALGDSTKRLQADRVQRRQTLIAEYQKDIEGISAKITAAKAQGDAQGELSLLSQLTDLQNKQAKVRDEGYKFELSEVDRVAKERKQKLDNQLRDEATYVKQFNDLLGRRSTNAIDRNASAELDNLARLKEDEIITEEQYNAQKLEIEKRLAQDKEALSAMIRGREIASEREHTLKLLEEDKLRLEQRRQLAIDNNDSKLAEQLGEQLDGVVSQIEEKQDVFLALGDQFRGVSNEFVSGLFEFDEDAVKAPLRKMFSILAGFITRLASAKVVEVLLGSLVGAAGLPGMLATFLLKPLIETGINAVISPVLAEIVSFSTGTIVDKPTLAVVGDRAGQGVGDMTEYILGSDQLSLLLSEVLNPMVNTMRQGFTELVNVVNELQFKLQISGNDLVTATDRARTANNRRAILPYSTVSIT
jgi:TP901 family phage tail tape measure protein